MPPKPKPEVLADYQRLKNTLAISGVQKWNTAVYEILVKLIDLVSQSQNVITDSPLVIDDPSGLEGLGTANDPLRVSVDGVTVIINAENKLETGGVSPDFIPDRLPLTTIACRKFGYAQKEPSGGQHLILSGLNGAISSSGIFTQLNDVTPGVGGVCSHWARGTYSAANANTGIIFFPLAQGVFWECKLLYAVRFRTGALLNGNDALGTPANNTKRVYAFGLANTVPTGATAVIGYPHVFVICDAPDKLNGGAAGLLEVSTRLAGAQSRTALTIPFLANSHYFIIVQAMSNTSSKVTVKNVSLGTQEIVSVSHDNFSSTSIAGTTNDNFGAFCMASNGVSVASTSTFDWNSLYLECD